MRVRIRRLSFLRERADRDTLSGLLLRRPFLESMRRQLSYAERRDDLMTRCMLDIGERIDATLRDMLYERYGADRVSRADEAGFSVAGLGDSGTAIAHVFEAVERSGFVPGEERDSLEWSRSELWTARESPRLGNWPGLLNRSVQDHHD